MERLIDANKLWLAMASDQTVDQYCYPCAERIGKAIREQPTVEAIPITWLKRNALACYGSSDNPFQSVLKAWEMENHETKE